MPSPTLEESQELESVLDGLAAAFARNSDVGDLDPDELERWLGNTLLEKLVYYGLKGTGHLDDVTHSWYIAGAKTDTPSEEFDLSDLRDRYENIRSSQVSVDERAEEYADYFAYQFDLEHVWDSSGEDFLLEYYQDEAPEEYRDLYIASQELRNLINQTIRELYTITKEPPDTSTLSEYGQDVSITGPEHYEEATEIVSRIHLELAQDEQLRETLPEYRAFTDILEDAYLALSKMEVERIDITQFQAFKRLRSFHFFQAWRLPALVISTNTTKGPRGEDLKLRHAQEISNQREYIHSHIDDLERKCADATLNPTIADYPSYHRDGDELVGELTERYLLEQE